MTQSPTGILHPLVVCFCFNADRHISSVLPIYFEQLHIYTTALYGKELQMCNADVVLMRSSSEYQTYVDNVQFQPNAYQSRRDSNPHLWYIYRICPTISPTKFLYNFPHEQQLSPWRSQHPNQTVTQTAGLHWLNNPSDCMLWVGVNLANWGEWRALLLTQTNPDHCTTTCGVSSQAANKPCFTPAPHQPDHFYLWFHRLRKNVIRAKFTIAVNASGRVRS